MELSERELERYSRHILMPEVGIDGQRKLKKARVLIVGLGGLGVPCATYLVAAGVGCVGLVDDERVELNNLQRQVLYAERDAGHGKLERAYGRLAGLNSNIDLLRHETRLGPENAEEVVSGYDVIVDCSDNFDTRYLINDAGVFFGKPVVFGAIHRFDGQVAIFDSPSGPCYRCIFPLPPEPEAVPDCSRAGVFGVLAALVGSLQATEVLKLFLGIGKPLIGQLLLYNALDISFQKLQIRRSPGCPVCGDSPTIKTLADSARATSSRCLHDIVDAPAGADQVNLEPAAIDEREITSSELADLIRDDGLDGALILDVRKPEEYILGSIPGSVLLPYEELQKRLEEVKESAGQNGGSDGDERKSDPGLGVGLTSDRKIYVFCQSGARSRKACLLLWSAGYEGATNLSGGFLGWQHRRP